MGRFPSELIITIRNLPEKEAAILPSIGMCIASSGARVFDRFSSLARNAIVWSSHTQQLDPVDKFRSFHLISKSCIWVRDSDGNSTFLFY